MRHVNLSPSGSSKSLDLFVARSLPPDSIWKGPVRYAGLYSSSVRRTRFTESHDSSRNEAEQRESEALLSLHPLLPGARGKDMRLWAVYYKNKTSTLQQRVQKDWKAPLPLAGSPKRQKDRAPRRTGEPSNQDLRKLT